MGCALKHKPVTIYDPEPHHAVKLQSDCAAATHQETLCCRGKTMGIIGYGSIGQACASIARAYRCGPLHDNLHLCFSMLTSQVHSNICSQLPCCRMDIIALRRRPERSAEEQAQGLRVSGQPHVASRVPVEAKVC